MGCAVVFRALYTMVKMAEQIMAHQPAYALQSHPLIKSTAPVGAHQTFANIMIQKTLAGIMGLSLLAACSSSLPVHEAVEEGTEITKMDLKSLNYDLPTSIRLRSDLAALQRPEFVKSMKELRLGTDIEDSRANPSSSVRVYRAWDGFVFLVDDYDMALWVRANNEWMCLVAGLRVDKTMGGAPSALPVRYVGGGYFAITETVPGDVAENSERGFPQALGVTFLIDSNSGKVKERSEAFIYDHNPPVRVPKSRITRYKLKSEQ